VSFFIKRAVLEQIEELARRGFPYEICGFLGGTVLGQGQEAHPAKNIARSPEVEYNIAPEETLMALFDYEGRGLKLTGVYHSHPRYPARPSGTDLRLADLPGAVYLITSVYDEPDGNLRCQTRAWRLERGKPSEAELKIIE
jgi:proteasome lid subunit RPN8/RPN11